jgi:hypothetical protein
MRYDATENLYRHAEIATFRGSPSPAGMARKRAKVVIATYGAKIRAAKR